METINKTEEILNLIKVITALQRSKKAKKVNNPIAPRKRGRQVSYNVECLECGNLVRRQSHNAKYCSDECKSAFFRDRKRAIQFVANEDTASILSYLDQSILIDLPLLDQ